jgi:hypothetical protein
VSFSRYALLVFGIVCGSLGMAWPILMPHLDAAARIAAIVGGVLAAMNSLAAYALVLWSAPRGTNVFLGAVLGGMVGRMGVLLCAVVAGILGLGLPKLPLAFSLLGYFVVFLVIELAILQKRTTPAPGRAH